MERAACRNKDPELFFTEKSGNGGRADAARAVAICQQQCPVILQCRQHAKATGERHGVWGGQLIDDGKPLPDVLCGTESGYNRHRRLKEPVCIACRKASNKAREKRSERRAAREAALT
ncbi:hypothetical protein BST13_35330 [Mycobacterium aquaticum]|uniref:Transcriptional regulator WhiB n=2 Tax=Mycobacterium aquaticum TaxID=1927124 RepID=A0A1X0A0Z9_9MYCO|nr:hypothetical protein BST13_35330 [Mycobacterium aquaticum]